MEPSNPSMSSSYSLHLDSIKWWRRRSLFSLHIPACYLRSDHSVSHDTVPLEQRRIKFLLKGPPDVAWLCWGFKARPSDHQPMSLKLSPLSHNFPDGINFHFHFFLADTLIQSSNRDRIELFSSESCSRAHQWQLDDAEVTSFKSGTIQLSHKLKSSSQSTNLFHSKSDWCVFSPLVWWSSIIKDLLFNFILVLNLVTYHFLTTSRISTITPHLQASEGEANKDMWSYPTTSF